MLSSSAGALAEAQTGWHAPDLVVVVDDGTRTGPNGSTSHDKPSRSVNSVFTPTNEWHSSDHCACVERVGQSL